MSERVVYVNRMKMPAVRDAICNGPQLWRHFALIHVLREGGKTVLVEKQRKSTSQQRPLYYLH